MIRILFVLPIFWDAVLTVVSQTSSETCYEGEVISNHCLECLCSENSIYNCTSTGVPCPKHIDKNQPKKRECEPQVVYVYKDTTCMCLKNGRWPHKRCRNVFSAMPSKQTCTPNSYVIEDCNVCRCDSTGKVDRKQCTQNDCSELIKRRSSKLDNVQGSCEPNNWYSLAPCQFCYCVNENKLVCSTGYNKLSTVLELGAYNLTVCGKQMIKEVIELVPEVQRSLRGGSMPPEEVTTEMTTKDNEEDNLRAFERLTTETVIPKPMRLYTTHRKPQVLETYDNVQGYREEKDKVKNVNQIDNKDADSDSSEEVDVPIAPTSKFTRKLTRRTQTVTPANFYQGDESSEESLISVKPKVTEVITVMPLQNGPLVKKKTHLKIPLSAKVTFENVVDKPKPHVVNAASAKSKEDVYKINIPSMLDKILSMKLKRRSIVKLNAQSNCVPGQTTKEGCNNCFCMANGKLLCTHKSCNGTISEAQ